MIPPRKQWTREAQQAPRPASRPLPRADGWPLWLQVELNIVAGYGSPKDVAVYAALGLSPSQTYIVGRAVRKLQAQCQVRAKGRGGGAGAWVCGHKDHLC